MTIVPNIFFIGVGVVMLWQILVAPAGRLPQPGDPGPWVLPAALAVMMIALGVLEIMRGMRRRHAARSLSVETHEAIAATQADMGDADVGTLEPPSWPARLIFVAALLGYVALFTRLGFTLSTAAFLLVAIIALTGRTLRGAIVAAIVAVVASLAIGWLLAGLVGVPLPGVLLLP